MKAILPCFFLLLLGPPFAAIAADENPPSIYSVPKWSKPVSTDAPDEAFQIEVLNVSGDPKTSPNDRFALAWSDDGLIVWADVQDPSPQMSSNPRQLWRGDALDIYLTSLGPESGLAQLTFSPGRLTPDKSTPWHYGIVNIPGLDKEALPEPIIQVSAGQQGYQMSVVIPWGLIPGNFVEAELGFQAYIKHVGDEGVYLSHWHPARDTWRNAENSNRLRLADEASAPVQMQAAFAVKGLREVELTVRTTPDLVGGDVLLRCVESTDDSLVKAWTKLGVVQKEESIGLARITMPSAFALASGSLWEVKVGSQLTTNPLAMPDIQAIRSSAFQSVLLDTESTIFSGEALPMLGLQNPLLVEAVFGDVEIVTRYFDAEYNEVSRAEKPGRYGALVIMTTHDGITEEREFTLFRTEEAFSSRFDLYRSQISFPKSFGIPDSVVQSEQSEVNRFVSNQLYNLPEYTPSWATLLAGLHDIAKDPEAYHGLSVWDIHNFWWYGLRNKLGQTQPYERLIYLPEGYEDEPNRQWPLLIFLHGSGERGDNLNKVKKHGPPKLCEDGQSLPFIVLAPQCPSDEWWNPDKLYDLLQTIQEEYRVDADRIYITGLSMGGHGTWALIGRYPDAFAAAAPICGRANPELADRITSVSVWVFHGGADTIVPAFYSERMGSALEDAGGDVKLTIYPEAGHDSWTETYSNEALYQWFLQHEN